MYDVLLTFVICYPLAVVVLFFLHPDSPITRHLIPRFLAKTRHPKHVLREVGCAWSTLGLWCIAVAPVAARALQGDSLDNTPWVLGVFGFILPVAGVVLLLAGLFHFFAGVFGRGSETSPIVTAATASDPDDLQIYLRRLARYLRINVVAFGLTLTALLAEGLTGIRPTGVMVLVNVGCLITFILTLWRIREYAKKSSIVLNLQRHPSLNSGAALIFWFVSDWIRGFRVLRLAAAAGVRY